MSQNLFDRASALINIAGNDVRGAACHWIFEAGSGSMQEPVQFRAEDGTVLRGLWFAAGPASPGIVLINGFGALKEMLIPFAIHFQERGMNVLLYDHRCFGASDGEPRQHVDPAMQVADLRCAIGWMTTQPGMEKARIGLMGGSLAGGHVMVAAALVPQVSCIVSISPFVSGLDTAPRYFAADRRRELAQLFAAERQRRMAGLPPSMVPIVSAADELMCLPPKVSSRFIEKSLADAPDWRNEVTLQSLENLLSYQPLAYARHVSPAPMLMIVGDRDNVCFPDLCLDAYDRALEPKRLLMLPTGHWGFYYPPLFERCCSAAAQWFAEHLGGDR